MTVAASFGLASALSVVVLGDESGYTVTEHQKMKIAAIEAMWETEEAPASFTIFGLPNLEDRTTHYEVSVPWMLGLIATRSINKEVPGIKELVEQAERKIRTGMEAYEALLTLRANPDNLAAKRALQATVKTLGYGLLLKRYTDKVVDATDEQIAQAAWDTVPRVAPLFWSFRLMVGLGFYFIAFFAFAFYLSARRRFERVSLVPVGGVVQPAAAVDLVRAGLVRRRIRPAALGHRGRPADLPGSLQRVDGERVVQPHRLYCLLLGAGHRRCLPDGQIHTHRPVRQTPGSGGTAGSGGIGEGRSWYSSTTKRSA